MVAGVRLVAGGAGVRVTTGEPKFKALFSAIQEGKAVRIDRMNALYKPVLELINNKINSSLEFSEPIKNFIKQNSEYDPPPVFFLESFPRSVLVEGATERFQAVFLKQLDNGVFVLDDEALIRNEAHMKDKPVRIGRFDVKEDDGQTTISFVDKKEGFIAQGKLCNSVAAAIFNGNQVVLLNPDPNGSDASQFKAPGGAVGKADFNCALEGENVNYPKMFALAAIRELLEECFGFENENFNDEFYATLKDNNTIKIKEVEYEIEAHVLLHQNAQGLNRYFDNDKLRQESNGFCCSPTVILKLSAITQNNVLPEVHQEEGCGVPEYKNLADVLNVQNPINCRGLDNVLRAFNKMGPAVQEQYKVFGQPALPV